MNHLELMDLSEPDDDPVIEAGRQAVLAFLERADELLPDLGPDGVFKGLIHTYLILGCRLGEKEGIREQLNDVLCDLDVIALSVVDEAGRA